MFQRKANGSWDLVTEVTPNDGTHLGSFGKSVAVSQFESIVLEGTTDFVDIVDVAGGANWGANDYSYSGTAYLYRYIFNGNSTKEIYNGDQLFDEMVDNDNGTVCNITIRKDYNYDTSLTMTLAVDTGVEYESSVYHENQQILKQMKCLVLLIVVYQLNLLIVMMNQLMI